MPPRNSLSSEQRLRLEAEMRSPYKSVRRFFYIAFGLSGIIGAYIFLMNILSGHTTPQTLPNLLIQLTLTVAMGSLLWIERDK